MKKVNKLTVSTGPDAHVPHSEGDGTGERPQEEALHPHWDDCLKRNQSKAKAGNNSSEVRS